MELIKRFGRPRSALEFEYTQIGHEHNLPVFLQKEARSVIKKTFRRELRRHAYKIWIDVNVIFHKLELDQVGGGTTQPRIIEVEPWFRCNESHVVLENRHGLDDTLTECFDDLQTRFDQWIQKGSGFYLVKVKALRLIAAKFIPLSGGCEDVFVSLPKKNRNKIVNILGTEGSDQCFLDSIRTASTIYKKKERETTRVFDLRSPNVVAASQFDTRNLTYPTTLDQIRLFERRNPTLYINVFGKNSVKRSSTLCVLYHSKSHEKGKVKVDLYLHHRHFFLIRSLTEMLASGRNKKYVCRSCLLLFTTESAYKNHNLHCDHQGRTYRVPSVDAATVKFNKKEAMNLKGFQIYADCESMLTVDLQTNKTSKRRFVHQHRGIAVGAIRICTSNSAHNSELFLSIGENCVEEFLTWLDRQIFEMNMILDECAVPLRMEDEDWDRYLNQETCEICGVKFTADTIKVRDHNHLNGKYRAALCNGCNLGICTQTVKDICVTFHCFGRYDSALLIRAMARRARNNNDRFKVVQKSRENSMIVFYKELMFTDSHNFLSSSLANLMKIRLKDEKPNGPPVFPLIYQSVDRDREKYELLCKKGLYPYETLTGLDALDKTELPDKHYFFDSLRKEHITDDDMSHAQSVWRVFECKTMRDYLTIYLQTDVLGLSSVFEEFRQGQFRQLGLDPSFFFSLPHYSYHAMLKYTNVEFQLIQDPEIYAWMRSGVRGGNSYIARRFAKANAPELPDYDPTEPHSQLVYLDTRGLYSYALTTNLPRAEFRWLTPKEIEYFDFNDIRRKKSWRGFMIEADLIVDRAYHNELADFPPLPEHMSPDRSQWTNYQWELAELHHVKSNPKKLIGHLGRRDHYIVHGEHLLYCLKLGVKVVKIHRILTFLQSCWAKPYIEYLIRERQLATSVFMSNMLKLMANSI